MKKEVILAIAIGFGIGILITFGLYAANKTLKTENQIISPAVETKDLAVTPTAFAQSLSVASPVDQSIVKEGKALVSGAASPDIPILISYENGEKTVIADKKGGFETEISLISGENEIEIQAFFDNGAKVSKVITIVYSTAEI